MMPDPHFKTANKKRRMVNSDFLESIYQLLDTVLLFIRLFLILS